MKITVIIDQKSDFNKLTQSSFVCDVTKSETMFWAGEIPKIDYEISKSRFWLNIMPKALEKADPKNWDRNYRNQMCELVYFEITQESLNDLDESDKERMISIITDNIWESLNCEEDVYAITKIYSYPLIANLVHFESK